MSHELCGIHANYTKNIEKYNRGITLGILSFQKSVVFKSSPRNPNSQNYHFQTTLGRVSDQVT